MLKKISLSFYSNSSKDTSNNCTLTCLNSGSCYFNSYGFQACNCLPGYTGSLCQSKISSETTTTTMSPKTCVDYNSTLCQSYAAKGYCSLNLYVNGALISVSCAASCNPTCKTTTNAITTTTTTKTCSDYNPSLCHTFASNGYCSLNAYINKAPIKVSCAVSCHSCI